MSTDTDESAGADRQRVNPGYFAFQLARAFTTAGTHDDPAIRRRARERIDRWVSAMNGILSGAFTVGSRAPIEGVPVWATPEVITGGFVTGRLLAEGPLLDHERALLARFPGITDEGARATINAYYLSEEGFAELRAMVGSGRYEITVAEEGALPVVLWLMDRGHANAARDLLDIIVPWFPRLRFYPKPSDRPQPTGRRVFLQDVGRAIEGLSRETASRNVLAQKEAIEVWIPLYDRMVELFMQTVEGPIPDLGRDGDRSVITGGWPCRHYPERWRSRAEELLRECDESRMLHKLCGWPERRRGQFLPLREYLQRCITDPVSLSGRDVGHIRLMLAGYAAKRGAPDSERCRALRRRQTVQAAAPTFAEIAPVLVERLAAFPRTDGLHDPEALTVPIMAEDAPREWKRTEPTSIPPHLRPRCSAAASTWWSRSWSVD